MPPKLLEAIEDLLQIKLRVILCGKRLHQIDSSSCGPLAILFAFRFAEHRDNFKVAKFGQKEKKWPGPLIRNFLLASLYKDKIEN